MKIALALAAIAALVFTPQAAADVPGLAAFVGSWRAHASRLVIQADRTGKLTYSDPSCSYAPPHPKRAPT